MHIVREECDERQIRVDRMIDEFRKAQSRRVAKATAVKGDDRVVESRDAPARAAAPGSTTTPTSHSND
jgi:hypothetical protein